MLRLIMQDDKSEAQGARLPLKSCFCRRAFRFNVCNKCIYRSKREEEELCEGSRGKTKYMQKGKSCCEDLDHWSYCVPNYGIHLHLTIYLSLCSLNILFSCVSITGLFLRDCRNHCRIYQIFVGVNPQWKQKTGKQRKDIFCSLKSCLRD